MVCSGKKIHKMLRQEHLNPSEVLVHKFTKKVIGKGS
jgi:hypothetical protein